MNIRLTTRALVSFGRIPYSIGRLTKKDWAFVAQNLSGGGRQSVAEMVNEAGMGIK
ncbi:hypothetical protein [Fictibacillus enclensis]|uniref:hypothetical protein n=1 Tax=Fictibacillus enclensis TaxID=1017270 RepID=UPI003CD0C5A3